MAEAVRGGAMHHRTTSRSLPHTSRQPGESRNSRLMGHDLTARSEKPSDWMGLSTGSRPAP